MHAVMAIVSYLADAERPQSSRGVQKATHGVAGSTQSMTAVRELRE